MTSPTPMEKLREAWKALQESAPRAVDLVENETLNRNLADAIEDLLAASPPGEARLDGEPSEAAITAAIQAVEQDRAEHGGSLVMLGRKDGTDEYYWRKWLAAAYAVDFPARPSGREPDALGLSESELEALNLSIGELKAENNDGLRRRIIALRDRLSGDAARREG